MFIGHLCLRGSHLFLLNDGVGISDACQHILSGNVVVVSFTDLLHFYSFSKQAEHRVHGNAGARNDRFPMVHIWIHFDPVGNFRHRLMQRL